MNAIRNLIQLLASYLTPAINPEPCACNEATLSSLNTAIIDVVEPYVILGLSYLVMHGLVMLIAVRAFRRDIQQVQAVMDAIEFTLESDSDSSSDDDSDDDVPDNGLLDSVVV